MSSHKPNTDMIHRRLSNENSARREVMEAQSTLFEKLEAILLDPELNLRLYPYLQDLVIPGMVSSKMLTQEEANHLLQVSKETFNTHSMLTPEQLAVAERHAVSSFSRDKGRGSPFAPHRVL